MDDLMGIGPFAAQSGLSVYTLRHYDAVGLLVPAEVDATTGYRRYRRSQLDTARTVTELRWLDLPLDDVRTLLADPDGEAARTLLSRHRDRLVWVREHLWRQLAALDRQLATHGAGTG